MRWRYAVGIICLYRTCNSVYYKIKFWGMHVGRLVDIIILIYLGYVERLVDIIILIYLGYVERQTGIINRGLCVKGRVLYFLLFL